MKQCFTQLHLHTSYSLKDSTIDIDKLIKVAKKNKIRSLAITDHLNMFATMKFYQKCIFKTDFLMVWGGGLGLRFGVEFWFLVEIEFWFLRMKILCFKYDFLIFRDEILCFRVMPDFCIFRAVTKFCIFRAVTKFCIF